MIMMMTLIEIGS